MAELITAAEIWRKAVGKSKNPFTPRIVSRGILLRDPHAVWAYEIASGSSWINDRQTKYGLAFECYLPDFDLCVKPRNLGGLYESIGLARHRISVLKSQPGLVRQSIVDLDEWRCSHGFDRWRHRECFLAYHTGDEKYREKILLYDAESAGF